MKIYLVGGAVRDQLLGKPVHEHDYVVVGANAQDMLARGFRQVGKDFPVFLHPQTGEEYALARTERKNGQGYTGFAVSADATVTLKDDLLRRDLTINAIAQDDAGQLIDPYHGLDDIKQKSLRHVSPAFAEDPLRVLRVARFAARFAEDGFTVAPETLALMQAMSAQGELSTLAAERVWRETEKALTSSSPHVYWQVLVAANALTPWFAELTDTLNTSDMASQLKRIKSEADTTIAWALTCQRLNHAQLTSLQQRLRVPNDYQDLTGAVLKINYQPHHPIDADWAFQAICQADGWRRPEKLARLVTLWKALGLPAKEAQQLRLAFEQAQSVKAKDIIAIAAQNGEPLNGPEIGVAVREAQRTAMQNAWQS